MTLSEDIREWGTSDRFPPARDQLIGWAKRVAEMERDLRRLTTIAAYSSDEAYRTADRALNTTNGTAKRGRKVKA